MYPAVPDDRHRADLLVGAGGVYEPGDLGTGRPLYEWEAVLKQVLQRVDVIEDSSAPGAAIKFQHNQSTPAATWSITHLLNTKPMVLIVAADGSQLHAQVDFPDDDHVVITHSQPYAGTAFLRG